jgi:hypothetical protein
VHEQTERERRVVLLLESLNDYLPSPRTASGSIAAQGPSIQTNTCGTCSGEGRTKYGRCHTCGGEGAHAPAMESYQLDAEIARLEEDKQAREGKDRGSLYGWERERRRMEKHGDYRALRRALDLLGSMAPGRVSLVRAVHVDQVPVRLSEAVKAELADVIYCLAELMPTPIRVPSWIDSKAGVDASLRLAKGRGMDDKQRARRDVEIRSEAARGARQVDLAVSWGLSTRQIRTICATGMVAA